MIIDINTVFFAIIMIGIVIALLLMVVGRGVDSSLLYWAGGFGINSLAFLLIALRGAIPDLASIWLANILIVASYALLTYGLLRFLNRKMHPFLIWAPAALIAVCFPFLPLVESRIILSGMMTSAECLLMVYLLISSNAQLIGRGRYILLTGFLVGVVVSMARPVTIILGVGEISAFNSPGFSQSMTYVTLTGLHVALALGLVLMQKEHAEAATDSIARSDELTGLPNRRRLYERLNQLLSQNTGHREFAALMLIDLDNFKPLNDQYGHAMGDELLRQTATRISNCTDGKDTTARLGGDEFVVLLTQLGDDRDSARQIAMQKAEAVQDALAMPYFLRGVKTLQNDNADVTHQCSGSVGVAMIGPDVTDREILMREADRAMYRAKNDARIPFASSTVPA